MTDKIGHGFEYSYGIKASELIKELQLLINEHGDCRVVASLDYDPVCGVSFIEHSFIGSPKDGFSHPAFEIE